MDFTKFLNYPIQILGINETYNDEIEAIENFVISDMKYTGDQNDLVDILPYFVFYFFCQNRRSSVSAKSGEQTKTAEFTMPSYDAQKNVWNIGVEKLKVILLSNHKTVSYDYNFEFALYGM